MKILGIDPSLTQLGWGVIQCDPPRIRYISSGIVKTGSEDLMQNRLYLLSNSIEQVINLHQPDLVAMEETFINTNAGSSLKLGYVRGAVMALIGKHNLPFFEYKPNAIKKTVVGVGHAEKDQVLHMIKVILTGASKVENFDEADALAVAYTCSVYSKCKF